MVSHVFLQILLLWQFVNLLKLFYIGDIDCLPIVQLTFKSKYAHKLKLGYFCGEQEADIYKVITQ
jgi:hypothetical protein